MISKTSNWVISIGVNSSQDHEHLNCSHFDASDVFNIMIENWECNQQQRILLIDKEATTSNVTSTLNEILMRLAGKNDRIFIYLSGHIDTNVRSITGFFVKTCKKFVENGGVKLSNQTSYFSVNTKIGRHT